MIQIAYLIDQNELSTNTRPIPTKAICLKDGVECVQDNDETKPLKDFLQANQDKHWLWLDPPDLFNLEQSRP
ncbi:hypothetical protein [Vibrio mediterranei]|uniref:hypothetical protein n=1 Tax=Vibrio mediterranei TaxID=689 RepID=UPI004068394F